MNKLNRKMEYALMALKHMCAKELEELTSTKEVCQTTGSPFDATARVMQAMANKGLLKSEQGVRGGYRIVRDLGRVSLYELIEIVEGPITIAKCIHAEGACELMGQCNIQTPVDHLNGRIREFYTSLSLREILDSTQARSSEDQ